MIFVLFVAVLLFMQSRNKKDMIRGSFLAIILMINALNSKFIEQSIVPIGILNVFVISFVIYLYIAKGRVR